MAASRAPEDLPVLIEVVDEEDRIRGALPILDEMVTEGLITLEDVDVLFYRANQQKVEVPPTLPAPDMPMGIVGISARRQVVLRMAHAMGADVRTCRRLRGATGSAER